MIKLKLKVAKTKCLDILAVSHYSKLKITAM